MDATRLRGCVSEWSRGEPTRLGARFEYHPRIGSTNDRARDLAVSGEPEGTVVVAGEQLSGRGRAARAWHSKADLGVYMSVILRPAAAPATVPLFGLMAANSVVDALDSLGVDGARIEWPNDIVAVPPGPGPWPKLAGILTEARSSGDRITDLVIGIGVNVNHAAVDFPPDLRRSSTSMLQATGRSHDRCSVVGAIVQALSSWYLSWEAAGEEPIRAGFRERAVGLEGRRVRVGEGRDAWSGVTAGLSSDGAIRIRRAGPDAAATIAEIRQGDFIRIEEAG